MSSLDTINFATMSGTSTAITEYGSQVASPMLCAAKDETSVEFMRPLLNSWAECSVVISYGKVDYDKSG
jgi:hypothetical protein